MKEEPKIVKWWEVVNNLANSFNTKPIGYSGRKLTAFAILVLVYYIHFKFLDNNNAVEVLIVDLCAVMLLFGLVSFQQLLSLKNGTVTQEKVEVTATKTTTETEVQ